MVYETMDIRVENILRELVKALKKDSSMKKNPELVFSLSKAEDIVSDLDRLPF